MRIAILGPQGTFSDKAYLEYAKQKEGKLTFEPEYYPTIDEVFSAVCPGDCDLGIVPVENTEEIEKLYVQFKANGQCRQFINSLENIKIVVTDSNMESYYKLENEAGAAAIVPKHIAQNEADRFVIENVTDAKNNHTRFLIIKKGTADSERITEFKAENAVANVKGKVRIPVYIMPATDRPGILFEILKSFSEKQINLISIMSRPTKQEMGTYNFYIEIDGLYSQLEDILNILNDIKQFNEIKMLGIYNE